jgi:hypothetical protein
VKQEADRQREEREKQQQEREKQDKQREKQRLEQEKEELRLRGKSIPEHLSIRRQSHRREITATFQMKNETKCSDGYIKGNTTSDMSMFSHNAKKARVNGYSKHPSISNGLSERNHRYCWDVGLVCNP